MDNVTTKLLETSIRNDFDTLLETHIPNTFPALSMCVLHHGNVVLNKSWGWIDPDTQQHPVTDLSLFDLASVTKLFVETVFLALVSDGRASLDGKLVDVIPEFGEINPRPIHGGQDPHTREQLPIDEQFTGQSVDPTQVTFKHLLTHSSGLPPWRDVFNRANAKPPEPPQANQPIDTTRWQHALKAMVNYPFVGTIGDTVRYSDIGIMLLGEAVARLNGTTLDDVIHQQFGLTLGLSSLGYNPVQHGIPLTQIVPTEFDTLWRNRRAWGEVHDENACGVGGIAGHAGLFATAYDVAQFGRAWLYNDPILRLSDDLHQRATQQQASGQFRLGLGWMLKAAEGSSAGDLFSMSSYGHTGFTGTSLWIDPDQQIVSTVLTNRVYHGRNPDGIHSFRRTVHDLIVQGIREL